MKDKEKWLRLGGIVFWLAVWELAAHLIGREVLLPSVESTVFALVRRLGDGRFYAAAGMSILRISIGIAGGIAFGGLTGALAYASAPARAVFSPLMRTVRATPVASVIILMLVWLRDGIVPAFAAGIMTAPVLYASVYEGLLGTDAKMLEMARLYRIGLFDRVRCLFIPCLRPSLTAAVTNCIGLGWKAGIAAEVIARPLRALGSEICDAKSMLETADLFAVTVFVVLVSILCESILRRVLTHKGGTV